VEDIRVDVGVCTVFSITLTDEELTDAEKVIFTVKNAATVDSPVIIEREFTSLGEHKIIIQPEESIKLTEHAVYDFNRVLKDGTRIKLTDNGKVILRKGVGDCVDD
jgi:hypothetical protein